MVRRSLIAWRKRLRTLRVPAGEPLAPADALLTESGEPLLTESGVAIAPES